MVFGRNDCQIELLAVSLPFVHRRIGPLPPEIGFGQHGRKGFLSAFHGAQQAAQNHSSQSVTSSVPFGMLSSCA
jgi:hypothetical protein